MGKKVLHVAIILSTILLLADYSLCSDESYDAGYRLGRKNGQIDRESASPSDPSGTASAYEWVANANNYDIASFRKGFIDGYEAVYGHSSRVGGGKDYPNEIAIVIFIIACIGLLFVFKVYPALKKKERYKKVQSSIESTGREMNEEIRYIFLAYVIKCLHERFKGPDNTYYLTDMDSNVNIIFLLKEAFGVPLPYHNFKKETGWISNPFERFFVRISEDAIEADYYEGARRGEYDTQFGVFGEFRFQHADKASMYLAQAQQFIEKYSSKVEELIDFLLSSGSPAGARLRLIDSAHLYFLYVNKLNRVLSAQGVDSLIKEAGCFNMRDAKECFDQLVKKGFIKLVE